MIALSPALSWVAFGAIAGFAVAVYLLASAWLDRREGDLPTWTFTEPEDPKIRIVRFPYDAVDRGDFE